jgi:prepilin-type N-terminal cleavage/methylation domain-containing protein
MTVSSEKGFSLIEVMISVGVLTVGVMGTAMVLTAGMLNLSSSPADVIVTQKAAQAIEAVFSARDSHRLTWDQIKNVNGATGHDGGIFLDGPQHLPLNPGPDGLVNTADDDPGYETIVMPGKDQIIGTADDQVIVLRAFTREILIRDVPNENGELRSITVTVIYQSGPTKRTYVLTTLISAYS